MRSRASKTSRTASTSSNDASTVRCMCSVSVSRGRWKPGRSTSTSCQSSPLATPKIRRRVVWGLSETIATFPPQSALTSVDLPTLGRPATATNPLFRMSQLERVGQELIGPAHEELALVHERYPVEAELMEPLAAG